MCQEFLLLKKIVDRNRCAGLSNPFDFKLKFRLIFLQRGKNFARIVIKGKRSQKTAQTEQGGIGEICRARWGIYLDKFNDNTDEKAGKTSCKIGCYPFVAAIHESIARVKTDRNEI